VPQGVSGCLRVGQGGLRVGQSASGCVRAPQDGFGTGQNHDILPDDPEVSRFRPHPTTRAPSMSATEGTPAPIQTCSREEITEVQPVPLQGRWMGTDNVTFTKRNFEDAFQERLDRKNPKPPLIYKVEMLDGYILENLRVKPERLCVVEFKSGMDAAIALSIRFIHVTVSKKSGMKQSYMVTLSVPGHNLTMQCVYSVIWKHLIRLQEIAEELKGMGAIRLSGLKEPQLSSDRESSKWYRRELIKVGVVIRLGGVCSIVNRKFLIASDSSIGDLLKDKVSALNKEECLIVSTLQQYQANGIVFEFSIPYEI